MLRGVIVIAVAREPPIVWTRGHETCWKYVIFPRIFHERSAPESNATHEKENKHGGQKHGVKEIKRGKIGRIPSMHETKIKIFLRGLTQSC